MDDAEVPHGSIENPYLTLKSILHALWELAVEATGGTKIKIARIIAVTRPWGAAESLARKMSHNWGISFEAFDSVLLDAKQRMRELVQVAAGNAVPFDSWDYITFAIVERLQELGESVPDGRNRRGPTADNLMKAELASNLDEVKGISAQKWATRIGRSKSAVINTPTWKSLQLVRLQAKAEKCEDRRRKKQHKAK